MGLKDKEEARLYVSSWRARRAGVKDTLTMSQWLKILDRHGYSCAYCGGPFEVMDHVEGLAVGNVASNVVPACQACNTRKGSNAECPPAPELSVKERRAESAKKAFLAWLGEKEPTSALVEAYARHLLDQGWRESSVYQRMGMLSIQCGVRLAGRAQKLRASLLRRYKGLPR